MLPTPTTAISRRNLHGRVAPWPSAEKPHVLVNRSPWKGSLPPVRLASWPGSRAAGLTKISVVPMPSPQTPGSPGNQEDMCGPAAFGTDSMAGHGQYGCPDLLFPVRHRVRNELAPRPPGHVQVLSRPHKDCTAPVTPLCVGGLCAAAAPESCASCPPSPDKRQLRRLRQSPVRFCKANDLESGNRN